MPVLEADRLILRPWRVEDAEAAHRIYGDPEITRFLGSMEPVPSVEAQMEQLETILPKYENAEDGRAFWAIWPRHSDSPVGSIILKPMPGSELFEIGWQLARPFWGNGYATEGARRGLDYALRECCMVVVHALVFPENSASIRVTERLGMRYVGSTSDYYNETLNLYEVLGADWP